MKMVLISLALLSSGAFARDWSDAEKLCGDGVYCIEDLVCVGQIEGQKPRGMHPSHYTQVLRLQSFKTVKNNGGNKVLVDTLGLGNDSAGDRPEMTIEQARKEDVGIYSYGPPAIRKNNKVKIAWGTMGGFSKGVTFQITDVQSGRGYETHKLVGIEQIAGSVVGGYKLKYECEATVVQAPSRIIDQTK